MVYDVVVIGLGSVGAATVYELSQIHNLKVVGIDCYQVPHHHSSHGGHNRIIRKAYFEHPNYVPLLQEAYQNWQDIEKKFHQKIYHPCGILYIGHPNHKLISGVQQAAQLYQINIEEFNISQLKNKYPIFKTNPSDTILYEADAGWIDVHLYLNTLLQNSQHSNVQLLFNEPLLEWNYTNELFHITTKNMSIKSHKIIFSNGPTMTKTLPFLEKHLTTTKQVYSWFHPSEKLESLWNNMPCWCSGHPDLEHIFYGVPNEHFNKSGHFGKMKFGFHKAGEKLHDWQLKNNINDNEKEILKNFINTSFEYTEKGNIQYDTCIYTNSTDEHFIIDFVPNSYNKALFISASSGHGFKFSPILGKIAKELIIAGQTRYNINLFKLERLLMDEK